MENFEEICNVALFFFRSICELSSKDFHNSPLWTFCALRKALSNHDVEEFERAICVESFLCKVYEDVKEPLISIVKSQLLDAVSNISKAEENVDKADILWKKEPKKQKISDFMTNIQKIGCCELLDKLNPIRSLKKIVDGDNIELNKISTESKSDGRAVVAVLVYNRRLKRDFTLRLALESLGKKGWRIVAPLNLKEVLISMDRANNE